MKIKELLNHPILELPKAWRPKFSSYIQSVLQTGRDYIDLLKSLDENEISGHDPFLGVYNNQSLIEGSNRVYQSVVNCSRTYLDEGNPHKAYNTFSDFFSHKENNLNSIQPTHFLEFQTVSPYLYRLREKGHHAELKDLFHVPFELRHKLQSNRYSIPGLPALYFSNSIFTAYKELGDPDYENLYVSKFELNHHSDGYEDLLDLRNRPQFDISSNVYKYLARWPLLMACSVKVGHPSAPFKPEYVIPQIVFQFVKNSFRVGGRKVVGVAYSSSKIQDYRDEYCGQFYNIAIPALQSNSTGCCKVLNDKFRLTKPVSFNEALGIKSNITQSGQVKSIRLHGAQTEYVDTDFGRIEAVLNQQPYKEMFSI